MPIPFYNLTAIPPGAFVPEFQDHFKGGVEFWKSEGLDAIIRGVQGNGTVAGTSLVVWREGGEMPLKDAEQTVVVIDEGLSVSWNGKTPPGPDDLDNGNPLGLSCVPVVMADGNVWNIPEVRDPSGVPNLPRDLVRNRKTKQIETPVRREYQELWTDCEKWFEFLFDVVQGTKSRIDLDDALTFATKLIGLRYRFCDATQSALRIIDSVNVQEVIQTALGWSAVMDRMREIVSGESQKKRE